MHTRKSEEILISASCVTLLLVMTLSLKTSWSSLPFPPLQANEEIFRVNIEGGKSFRQLCKNEWKDECRNIALSIPKRDLELSREELELLKSKIEKYLLQKGFNEFELVQMPLHREGVSLDE